VRALCHAGIDSYALVFNRRWATWRQRSISLRWSCVWRVDSRIACPGSGASSRQSPNRAMNLLGAHPLRSASTWERAIRTRADGSLCVAEYRSPGLRNAAGGQFRPVISGIRPAIFPRRGIVPTIWPPVIRGNARTTTPNPSQLKAGVLRWKSWKRVRNSPLSLDTISAVQGRLTSAMAHAPPGENVAI